MSLDEQINEVVLDLVMIGVEYGANGTPIDSRKLEQRLKSLIEKKEREARIDELQQGAVYDTGYQAAVQVYGRHKRSYDDRIAQLREEGWKE